MASDRLTGTRLQLLACSRSSASNGPQGATAQRVEAASQDNLMHQTRHGLDHVSMWWTWHSISDGSARYCTMVLVSRWFVVLQRIRKVVVTQALHASVPYSRQSCMSFLVVKRAIRRISTCLGR